MIKVGILGSGFGRTHAKIYKIISNIEIAGLYGRTLEKLKEIKDELDINVTTDINELLDNPEIDLVDICLPTSVHKEYVIKSIKKGKHVFCETPVSYTVEEAEEMQKCATKFNRYLFVDLFYKFSPPHRYTIEKVKTKTLGKPLIVTAYQKTPPHWGNMNLNKIVQDFTLHNFDFVLEILGTPKQVIANGYERDNSCIFITLKFDNGIASIESSTMFPGKFPFNIGFNVICELGTITFDGKYGENTEGKTMLYQNENAEEIILPASDDYEETIKRVVDHIINDKPSSLLSIEKAIESLKIVQQIKRYINKK